MTDVNESRSSRMPIFVATVTTFYFSSTASVEPAGRAEDVRAAKAVRHHERRHRQEVRDRRQVLVAEEILGAGEELARPVGRLADDHQAVGFYALELGR